MEITEDHRNRIEQIIKELDCPRRFECYRSEFEKLTPVEAGRFGELIECSLCHARFCSLKFNFDFGTCCTCPLRHYIARHFHK